MKKILEFALLGLTILFGSFSFFLPSFADGENDLTSKDFQINVRDITPGASTIADEADYGSQGIADAVLGKVIQSLMVVMGVLSLLVMTIGAGYMILHHGQEEQLSKGKAIFTQGLIGLAIALASYWIIALVRYILYYR